MDRIVCVILLSVAVSLVLNLSNAAPQTANGPLFPATAQAQTQAPGTVVTDAAGRTFNLAPLAPLPPLSPLAPLTAAQQQGAPGRLSFIDSIFKVGDDDVHQKRLLRTIRRAATMAAMAIIHQPTYTRQNASYQNYPYLIRFNQAYWHWPIAVIWREKSMHMEGSKLYQIHFEGIEQIWSKLYAFSANDFLRGDKVISTHFVVYGMSVRLMNKSL